MEDLIRNDLFSYLILFGIVQGIILGFVLLRSKRKNQTANRLLGLIILCFIIVNFDIWAGYTRYSLKFPHFVDISWPFSFAVGPLILLYYRAYLQGKLTRWDMLYMVPFFILFLYSFTFYLQEDAYKFNIFIKTRGIDLPAKEFIQSIPSNPWGIRTMGNKMLIFYMVVFLFLTFVELVRAIRRNQVKFSWANRHLLWLVSFFVVLVFCITVFFFMEITSPSAENEYVFAILFTLIIYFITYQFLLRSDFFHASPLESKYQKSSLTEQMKDEIEKKIMDLFETDKPYLNNLFSLDTLARNISTYPNYISQVINERMGHNFHELSARYRIAEAKRILESDSSGERTIEDIAFSVGYNSKSAFHKAFKKITGKTPVEFRK